MKSYNTAAHKTTDASRGLRNSSGASPDGGSPCPALGHVRTYASEPTAYATLPQVQPHDWRYAKRCIRDDKERLTGNARLRAEESYVRLCRFLAALERLRRTLSTPK
jgi:hypothetical protein